MTTKFPFKLGLKPSPRDDRDLKLCIEPNKVLPITYEIPIVRCIYSQQHNDCSSNAICNQIMTLKDWNDNTYPSRIFQYWISREVAGNTDEDEGCSYRDAYNGLSKYGFTDENQCPYHNGDVFKRPPQEAFEKANKTFVRKYKSIMPNQYSIKYARSQNLPVAFGTMIYNNFSPGEKFIIPLPSGEMLGGHALIIIGFSDKTRLFTVLNSWGANWGDNGKCYMRYEHILTIEWCFEFWVITKQ